MVELIQTQALKDPRSFLQGVTNAATLEDTANGNHPAGPQRDREDILALNAQPASGSTIDLDIQRQKKPNDQGPASKLFASMRNVLGIAA